MVSSKDKELGKLREEMEEQDREIQLLKEEKEDTSEQHEVELRELEKEKAEELRTLLKKKDDELKILKKRKDKEIQTLKEERVDPGEQQQEKLRELEKKKDEELREMMKMKGDELQMLEKRKDEELNKKNDELRMLQKEKDDGAKLIKENDKELKTLRNEVENLRKSNNADEAAATTKKGKILVDSNEWNMLKKDKEALQRSMNEKEVESGKLRKEKEESRIANASETRKLRDQLLQIQEQEQRRNQPWAFTGATRFLGGFVVDVRTRRPVPHNTWSSLKIEVPRDHYYVYDPNTTATSSPFPMINWLVVNEEPTNWPPPPTIGVHCQPGQFDKGNWWFVKTFSPDGRLAMVAYYDGSQTSYTNPNYLYPVRLAFPRTSKLHTTTPFFLITLNGTNKLAFMYRD